MDDLFPLIFKVGIVALIFFGLIYIAFLSVSPPEKCTNKNCEIKKSCEKDEDCMVSCGCLCVSKQSSCAPETYLGPCPTKDLVCGCENNICSFE